jgi:hypothetical protein
VDVLHNLEPVTAFLALIFVNRHGLQTPPHIRHLHNKRLYHRKRKRTKTLAAERLGLKKVVGSATSFCVPAADVPLPAAGLPHNPAC